MSDIESLFKEGNEIISKLKNIPIFFIQLLEFYSTCGSSHHYISKVLADSNFILRHELR